MSTYNGRRGPNVTAFLQEMHDNPGALETPQSGVGGFLDDKDLAMFTNTEFFDLELGQHTDYQPQPPPSLKPVSVSETEGSHSSPLDMEDPTSAATAGVDDFSIDFMADNHTFPYFGDTFTPPSMNTFPNLPAIQPQPQPQPMPAYAAAPQPPHAHAFPPQQHNGRTTSSPESHSDRQTREAEEDKRRRNTAASARFRVKKKQREQALEQAAKDMSDKVTVLEGRIQQLETENKWLKNMILEKNSGSDNVSSLLEKGLTKGGKDEAKSTSKADS